MYKLSKELDADVAINSWRPRPSYRESLSESALLRLSANYVYSGVNFPVKHKYQTCVNILVTASHTLPDGWCIKQKSWSITLSICRLALRLASEVSEIQTSMVASHSVRRRSCFVCTILTTRYPRPKNWSQTCANIGFSHWFRDITQRCKYLEEEEDSEIHGSHWHWLIEGSENDVITSLGSLWRHLPHNGSQKKLFRLHERNGSLTAKSRFGDWPQWPHASRPFTGPIFDRNHSQVYPHMRAKFGHDRSSSLAAYTWQTDRHTHTQTDRICII